VPSYFKIPHCITNPNTNEVGTHRRTDRRTIRQTDGRFDLNMPHFGGIQRSEWGFLNLKCTRNNNWTKPPWSSDLGR
jgi:hypothetical protein